MAICVRVHTHVLQVVNFAYLPSHDATFPVLTVRLGRVHHTLEMWQGCSLMCQHLGPAAEDGVPGDAWCCAPSPSHGRLRAPFLEGGGTWVFAWHHSVKEGAHQDIAVCTCLAEVQ